MKVNWIKTIIEIAEAEYSASSWHHSSAKVVKQIFIIEVEVFFTNNGAIR